MFHKHLTITKPPTKTTVEFHKYVSILYWNHIISDIIFVKFESIRGNKIMFYDAFTLMRPFGTYNYRGTQTYYTEPASNLSFNMYDFISLMCFWNVVKASFLFVECFRWINIFGVLQSNWKNNWIVSFPYSDVISTLQSVFAINPIN